MKGKGKWWVIGVGLLVLVVSSTALAGSVAAHKRFQNTFVCVNKTNGLLKIISRRQHNRCGSDHMRKGGQQAGHGREIS